MENHSLNSSRGLGKKPVNFSLFKLKLPSRTPVSTVLYIVFLGISFYPILQHENRNILLQDFSPIQTSFPSAVTGN